jgi:hypothetical protein
MYSREAYQIGVIYVKKGQSDEAIFENEKGSKEYLRFVEELGWLVHFSTPNMSHKSIF